MSSFHSQIKSLLSFDYYWYKNTLLSPLLLLVYMWFQGWSFGSRHLVQELLSGEANSPFSCHQWHAVLCLGWGCNSPPFCIYTFTDTCLVCAAFSEAPGWLTVAVCAVAVFVEPGEKETQRYNCEILVSTEEEEFLFFWETWTQSLFLVRTI